MKEIFESEEETIQFMLARSNGEKAYTKEDLEKLVRSMKYYKMIK